MGLEEAYARTDACRFPADQALPEAVRQGLSVTKVHLAMHFDQSNGSLPNPLDPKSVIRGVLFDLDGTLYRQRPLRSLMALELLTLPLKSPAKAPRHWQALRAFRRAQERLRETGSEPGATDLTRGQLEAAREASGLSVAEVEALVTDWMMKRPLKYLQLCRARGLDGLLAVIERAGVRAGVLSDYPADDKLRALGLGSRFAPVLSAADPEIRAFKPNPRGFLHACRLWGLPPSAVLFVGDRVEVDAAGAAAAGMPCAIVGRRRAAPHARYATFQSLEQLSRVFDPRA